MQPFESTGLSEFQATPENAVVDLKGLLNRQSHIVYIRMETKYDMIKSQQVTIFMGNLIMVLRIRGSSAD